MNLRFLIVLLCFSQVVLSSQTIEPIELLAKTNLADTSDAWAINTNPAGLTHIEGVSFSGGYFHAWREDTQYHNAAGALGFSIANMLAFGAGFDLTVPLDEQVKNGLLRGHFGAAFSIDHFSLGASTTLGRNLETLDSLPFELAVGTQWRLFSWFSIGALAEQKIDNFLDPWIFTAGVTFRPAKDYVVVSISNTFDPISKVWSEGYGYSPSVMLAINIKSFFVQAYAEANNVEQNFGQIQYGLSLGFLFDKGGFDTLGRMNKDGYMTAGGRFFLQSSQEESKS